MLRRLLPQPVELGRWRLKADPLNSFNPDPGYIQWSKLPPETEQRQAIEERLKHAQMKKVEK